MGDELVGGVLVDEGGVGDVDDCGCFGLEGEFVRPTIF